MDTAQIETAEPPLKTALTSSMVCPSEIKPSGIHDIFRLDPNLIQFAAYTMISNYPIFS